MSTVDHWQRAQDCADLHHAYRKRQDQAMLDENLEEAARLGAIADHWRSRQQHWISLYRIERRCEPVLPRPSKRLLPYIAGIAVLVLALLLMLAGCSTSSAKPAPAAQGTGSQHILELADKQPSTSTSTTTPAQDCITEAAARLAERGITLDVQGTLAEIAETAQHQPAAPVTQEQEDQCIEGVVDFLTWHALQTGELSP